MNISMIPLKILYEGAVKDSSFFKSWPKCLSVLTIGTAYELALQTGSSKEKFMKESTEVRRVENRK